MIRLLPIQFRNFFEGKRSYLWHYVFIKDVTMKDDLIAEIKEHFNGNSAFGITLFVFFVEPSETLARNAHPAYRDKWSSVYFTKASIFEGNKLERWAGRILGKRDKFYKLQRNIGIHFSDRVPKVETL